MLSLEQIKTYYPENLMGYERFMLREYLQYKILEIIFDSNFATKFAFIGGSALRIVHGNERFSEDLDFDNFGLKNDDLIEVSENIKKNLEKEGYQVEAKNVSRVAFHCYIRFPGLLYDVGLSEKREEKILIRFDTEAQHFDFKPERVLLNKFDVFTEIMCTPLNIILARKFYSVLNRPRNKGRDFFDIVFLFGKGVVPNYEFLKLKLGITNGAVLKEHLLVKLGTIDMKEMASDVQPFLFKSKDEKKVLFFERYIAQIKL